MVPEGVVDDLEAVEVEKHDRHQAVDALGVDHRLLQAFEQQRAVRQAGERVVVGEEAQPFLGLAPLGDVLDDGDEYRRRFGARASCRRTSTGYRLPSLRRWLVTNAQAPLVRRGAAARDSDLEAFVAEVRFDVERRQVSAPPGYSRGCAVRPGSPG